MRWIGILTAAVALSFSSGAFGQYPKQGVRLLSNIPLSGFEGSPASGSGGSKYISPSGREYAIIGVRNGFNVVEITNPTSPVIIGHVEAPLSTWHESAVLGNYLYGVADGIDQGVYIVDLSTADSGFITQVGTYTVNNLQRVHTIQAYPNRNWLYLNGTNRGFLILDASNPTNLVEIGRWTTQYVHDSEIVPFTSGPFAGHDIGFFCCGTADFYIVDVTNPAAMTVLDSLSYIVGNNYCHSGSLTSNGRAFLINDEFDESNGLVSYCTTHIVDVSDLTNISYAGSFTNFGNFIDHNSQIIGNTMYLSAYRGGLRIYNVDAKLNFSEIGYFDTYPEGEGFSYTGAWGVCAGFPSGDVTIYDINRGLFVLDPSEALGQGAPLTGATVRIGNHISGGVAELRNSDNSEFQAQYQERPQQETTTDIVLNVLGETSITPSNFLDIRVEGRVTNIPNAKGFVYLKNWGTGRYDNLGFFTIGTVESVGNFNGLPGGKYINASGQIDMRLRSSPNPSLDINQYRLFVDQVKFTVRRS